MATTRSTLPELLSAGHVQLAERHEPEPANDTGEQPVWQLAELHGRLVELSTRGASAALTLAFSLIVDAQRQGEPVAWLGTQAATFHPPDAAAYGADLRALLVVRVPQAIEVLRAADQLARSAGFGLLVLDLALAPELAVPPALVARLGGLAQKHDLTILCLTTKPEQAPSLGAMVSLRAVVHRQADGERHLASLTIIRDRRRTPGWTHAEVCRGPLGLR
jgi:recombination protein RecA